jgi:hypothetical protein
MNSSNWSRQTRGAFVVQLSDSPDAMANELRVTRNWEHHRLPIFWSWGEITISAQTHSAVVAGKAGTCFALEPFPVLMES